jgi:hypothetical protein
MWPSSGSAGEDGSGMRPAGAKPSAWTVTPSPVNAAALSPLKLLLVHTMRQLRPARSSVLSISVTTSAPSSGPLP